MSDMSDLWRKTFATWPTNFRRKGVVIPDGGEAIPFCDFVLNATMVVLERATPDNAGARRVAIPFERIHNLKYTEPLKTEQFLQAGFVKEMSEAQLAALSAVQPTAFVAPAPSAVLQQPVAAPPAAPTPKPASGSPVAAQVQTQPGVQEPTLETKRQTVDQPASDAKASPGPTSAPAGEASPAAPQQPAATKPASVSEPAPTAPSKQTPAANQPANQPAGQGEGQSVASSAQPAKDTQPQATSEPVAPPAPAAPPAPDTPEQAEATDSTKAPKTSDAPASPPAPPAEDQPRVHNIPMNFPGQDSPRGVR